MKLKRIILPLLIVVTLLGVFVPAVAYRHNFEQSSKVYIACVDATRLQWFFETDEIKEILTQYKDAGCTTAVFTERKGEYNQKHIKIANDLGYNIALAPDVSVKTPAGISEICEKYNVKYIKLQKSVWKSKYEAPTKSEPVCEVIKKHNLTLVLTETIWQLANEQPRDYEDYITAADGRILRTFNSYYKTNVDKKDYPVGYYQMYNSAYDRNTRFITVKQLEDEGFDAYENARRTQQNVKLFCEKMDSHGFVKEGSVNYNNYIPKTRVISAFCAFLSVLMLGAMAKLLIGNKLKHIEIVSIGAAVLALAVSFVMPSGILALYPTLFSCLAPCFCITVVAVFINKFKQKLSFLQLILLSTAVAVALFLACGTVIAATLSGADYFLNNQLFRGVKLSLVAPIAFTALLIFATSYKKFTLAQYKQIIADATHKIRWYHIVIACAFLAVGAVYVIRSGNVNKISFTEVYLRNLLTEFFAARPRTKEFLIGWPCFALYIYYANHQKSKLLSWGFALGSSILFASSINTFCHVFTMVQTMYMRIATGLLFGAVTALIALLVNYVMLKIFNKKSLH